MRARSCAGLTLVVALSCKTVAAPASKGASAADASDPSQYAADLDFIAAPRPPGSPRWQATQDRCADALAAAGLSVRRQDYGGGVNVIGRRDGIQLPGEVVLVGAHYDAVADCPGADDDASGVAGVLEIARALAGKTYRRTLMLGCWDQEEAGLRGSRAFVASLRDPAGTGMRLVGHFNLEMIAFASRAPGSQTIVPGFARSRDPRGGRLASALKWLTPTAASTRPRRGGGSLRATDPRRGS